MKKRRKYDRKPADRPTTGQPEALNAALRNGPPVNCAYDEMVQIASIRPNPRNPNKHPPEQVEKLAKLIKAHGWRNPITVSTRSGLVVQGHCRLLAAQKLGLKQAPVDYQDFDSDAQEWAVMVADNVIAELAEIEGLKMGELLCELDQLNYDLDLTALSPEQIENHVSGPIIDFKDLDNESKRLAESEDTSIVIIVPIKYFEVVQNWLCNGEMKTSAGMGRGVLKRCGLL